MPVSHADRIRSAKHVPQAYTRLAKEVKNLIRYGQSTADIMEEVLNAIHEVE